MRLLIYTAAIAVLLAAYGLRIEQMQDEVRRNHAYVESLERAIPVLQSDLQRHEERLAELNCVHFIYEDGSAVHLDAEVALDCLRSRLGWNHSSEIFRPQP